MNPANQKIIWTKGVNEISIGELYRLYEKYDFPCNGDRKVVHVCIKEENDETYD